MRLTGGQCGKSFGRELIASEAEGRGKREREAAD